MSSLSRTFFLATTLLLVFGCSPDEPLIDSFDESWRYLVTTPQGVATIRMPEGTRENSNVWTPADDVSPYPVQEIDEFRDAYYLLLSQAAIVVLDRTSLNAIDTIQLIGNGPAAGIAFANATTAYVALPESRSVGVIDLTVGELVATISVEGRPMDIDAVGNQVGVVLQDVDQFVLIDSRTNAVEARLQMGTAAPTYVAGVPSNDRFVVISLGAGKLSGDDRSMTTPTISFISIIDRMIVSSLDLAHRDNGAEEQLPRGVSVNSTGFAFIPVQQGLLFVNTRTPSKATPIVFDDYHHTAYHASRAEIIMVKPDGRTVEIYDEFAENRTSTAVLADSTGWIVGIAP